MFISGKAKSSSTPFGLLAIANNTVVIPTASTKLD
jgi:hypothetical protein